jgi:microcompartment protein CcmK/EutM
VINIRRYRRKEISGQEALASTARESVGAGLASSLGLVAGNLARAALLATSAAGPVSFAVATVVTAGTKLIWDRAVAGRARQTGERS